MQSQLINCRKGRTTRAYGTFIRLGTIPLFNSKIFWKQMAVPKGVQTQKLAFWFYSLWHLSCSSLAMRALVHHRPTLDGSKVSSSFGPSSLSISSVCIPHTQQFFYCKRPLGYWFVRVSLLNWAIPRLAEWYKVDFISILTPNWEALTLNFDIFDTPCPYYL